MQSPNVRGLSQPLACHRAVQSTEFFSRSSPRQLSHAIPAASAAVLAAAGCRPKALSGSRTQRRQAARTTGLTDLAELNRSQQEAVTVGLGPVLVLAGAGSGKTLTLVKRLEYLLASQVAPSKVVLLTFTKKAAEEMKRRAGKLVGAAAHRVRGGTFHSFCLKELRQIRARDGAPSPVVLDESDARDLLRSILADNGLLGKALKFPKPRQLQKWFSTCVNTGVRLQTLLLDFGLHVDRLDSVLKVQQEYEERKQGMQLLDFDDLLWHLDQALEDEETRELLARRCEHVLVDEYQDTNHLQASIVQKITSVHGNVMAVGDDAQSIYAFRGADIKNITHFEEMFPGCRVLHLEDNYRSSQEILDLSNALLQNSTECHRKHLVSHCTSGPVPTLARCYSPITEARKVAEHLRELRKTVPLQEVAVLYRANKSSLLLEAELLRLQVPFLKVGALKLLKRSHVKDLLGILTIAFHPTHTVAWMRVLQLIPGVGNATATQICQDLAASCAADALQLWGSLRRAFAPELQELAELVARLQEETSTVKAVEAAYGWYMRYFLHKYQDENAEEREEDLSLLLSVAESYESVTEMLSSLALDDDVADTDSDAVTLSTIHSAKGREWRVVFLIGCQQTFNEEDEEELRVLYVGLTRARRELNITCPGWQHVGSKKGSKLKGHQ
ncbi:unnamed protein product [Effrenium voratum]|nr:unnamed protein product [Effrenium voratum]